MKNMKKELFTAVAMLLVATVALGTASYAWFVNNATVAVDEMKFTASTSVGMEIALPTAWGNGLNAAFEAPTSDKFKGQITTVDLNTFFQGPLYYGGTLNPASTADTKGFFYDSKWDYGAGLATTFAAITTHAGVYAKKIPLYFRASEAMNVTFNASDYVTKQIVSGGSIVNAMRIAFVEGDNVKVFAPTTAAVVATAKNTTAGRTDTSVISAVDEFGKATFAKEPTQLALTTYAAKEIGTTDFVINGSDTKGTALFTLEPNVPKLITVYIWLEGTDNDCVSEVAKQPFDVNFNFIGAPTI